MNQDSVKVGQSLRTAFSPFFGGSKDGRGQIISTEEINASLSPMRCMLLEGENLCQDGRTMAITLGQDTLGEKFNKLSERMAAISDAMSLQYEAAKTCRFYHKRTRWAKRGLLRRDIQRNYGTGPDNSQWNVLMIRECIDCGDIQHKEYAGPKGVT